MIKQFLVIISLFGMSNLGAQTESLCGSVFKHAQSFGTCIKSHQKEIFATTGLSLGLLNACRLHIYYQKEKDNLPHRRKAFEKERIEINNLYSRLLNEQVKYTSDGDETELPISELDDDKFYNYSIKRDVEKDPGNLRDWDAVLRLRRDTYDLPQVHKYFPGNNEQLELKKQLAALDQRFIKNIQEGRDLEFSSIYPKMGVIVSLSVAILFAVLGLSK